jgi:hypothetical protein
VLASLARENADLATEIADVQQQQGPSASELGGQDPPGAGGRVHYPAPQLELDAPRSWPADAPHLEGHGSRQLVDPREDLGRLGSRVHHEHQLDLALEYRTAEDQRLVDQGVDVFPGGAESQNSPIGAVRGGLPAGVARALHPPLAGEVSERRLGSWIRPRAVIAGRVEITGSRQRLSVLEQELGRVALACKQPLGHHARKAKPPPAHGTRCHGLGE